MINLLGYCICINPNIIIIVIIIWKSNWCISADSYAPFLSLSSRESGFLGLGSGLLSPGPGQYNSDITRVRYGFNITVHSVNMSVMSAKLLKYCRIIFWEETVCRIDPGGLMTWCQMFQGQERTMLRTMFHLQRKEQPIQRRVWRWDVSLDYHMDYNFVVLLCVMKII